MCERITLEDFEKSLILEERSPNTIEKYLRDTRRYLEFAEEISKESVIEFKQYLIEQQYAPASINSMLASVNKYMIFAGLEDCCVKGLKIQRKPYVSEDKLLSRAEYDRLLKCSEDNEKVNLLIQTICGSGIRVSELECFTVEAVTEGEIQISLKGKTRNILLTGKLRKKLLKYAKKEGIKSGYIFVNRKGKPLHRSYIWAVMKKLCGKALVSRDKVFPHNLRKLFARSFYKLNKDISKLADILGHSSIDTTRIYIATSSREHIRTMEKLHLVT